MLSPDAFDTQLIGTWSREREIRDSLRTESCDLLPESGYIFSGQCMLHAHTLLAAEENFRECTIEFV